MSVVQRAAYTTWGESEYLTDQPPRYAGNPLLWQGAGEENLLRDAAMDTDTDGDGVVDGFQDNTGTATATLDGAVGAQKINRTSGETTNPFVQQRVLRVFPGDEVTASAEGKVNVVSGSPAVQREIRWYRSDGSLISSDFQRGEQPSSFTRLSISVTAPPETALVGVVWMLFTPSDAEGDIWFRDARLLRASSDPATWANPHVSGASQTGTSLDTAGWPASTQIANRGDFFVVGGSGETQAAADAISRYFQVTADVTTNASGEASIPISIPILSGASPSDGAALRLNDLARHSG